MRALLFGLFVGYFFAACAPVHWRSAFLWSVAITLLIVVVARWRVRQALQPSPLYLWVVSSCHFVIGLLTAVLTLGLAVNAVNARALVSSQTPICSNARLMLRVQLEGLPIRHSSGSRFDARVLDVDPAFSECQYLQGEKLRLGFRGPATLLPDQTLLAEFKLRPVRGSVSPGAFDHEVHSALQGVVLGGYVTQAFALRDPLKWSMDAQRFALRQYLSELDLDHPGVILALASGDTAVLGAEDWALLQDSGTVHLLVISGLHVGLVGALLFVLLRPFVRLMDRMLPGLRVAALLHASLTAAVLLIYVHWVGSSVPALRAWLMVTVVLVGWSLERRVLASSLLFVAAVGVVAMTPLAGLQAGFWLSFALVAWLLCVPRPAEPVNEQGDHNDVAVEMEWVARLWIKGRQLIMLHIGATLLLLPLLAWLGLPVAPVGPLANFFAVPYVTLLLVPWVLFSVLLLPFGAELALSLLMVADSMISILFCLLQWVVEIWPGVALPVFRLGVLLSALVCVVMFLLPLPLMLRGAAGSAVLIWLINTNHNLPLGTTKAVAMPGYGDFNLQMLDVGQGLSVVVGTAEAMILYDTGASFPSGFNYVDSVISPAMRRRLVQKLDGFVVSHADNDHAGGAQAVIEQFAPRRLAGSIPSVDSCRWTFGRHTSDVWVSAGVKLQLFNFEQGGSGNDRSCVLLISGAHARALLAGDIETSAERALLDQLPNGVDVVSVPHHGSATSSSEEFVRKLQPGLALVSAGFNNRFGHPNAEVVRRYQAVGSRVMNTAYEGTMSWESADVGGVISARKQRLNNWRLAAPLAVAMAVKSPLEQSFPVAGSYDAARE